MIYRTIVLCVAVALVCAALRVQRPEVASVVSLAAGLAALSMLAPELTRVREAVDALRSRTAGAPDLFAPVLKGAGIALIADFGAQICSDAGEQALAGRVMLSARVAMLSLCLPLVLETLGALDAVLS